MSHRPIHILHVEDDLDEAMKVRRLLREVLTTRGMQVMHVETGDDLLKMIAEFHPDVVLLDHHLPGRSGLTLLEELATTTPRVPVVMLTGYGDEDVAVAALKGGARDYVSKRHLDGPTLLRAILNALALASYESERNAADVKAAQAEQVQQALLHGSREAVLILDRHFGIRAANDPACHMLGWNVADLVGKTFHDIAHRTQPTDVHHDPHTCPLEVALRKNQRTELPDEHLWNADGRWIEAFVRTWPLDEQAPALGQVVFLQSPARPPEPDVDRRRVEEQERTDLLNIIGHLVQTPLTPLVLRVSQLKAWGATNMAPREQKALDAIARNLARLRAVIESATTVARLQRGEQRIRPAPHDVTAIASAAVKSVQTTAQDLQVKVVVHGPDARAAIDADALRQALQDILKAAIRRSPKGGIVHVDVATGEGEVDVVIRDAGRRLSAAEVRGMMDPFAFLEGNSATGDDIEHSLWFYVARLLIEAHGGRLAINSSGQETSFVTRLPIEGPERRLAQGSPAREARRLAPSPSGPLLPR